METLAMGKVIVPAEIENWFDLHEVELGTRSASAARRVEVNNAMVDTRVLFLSAPKGLIAQLGLKPARTRTGRTCMGTATFQVYDAVRLTVQGRDCLCEVAELPEDSPVLIGLVPLEMLDFVVDPSDHKLIGNPAHGGEPMIDMF